MTDEERQKTIDFILEQQAQFSVNIEALREAQARTDAAVGSLTIQVQNIARQQEHLNEVVAVIADAQPHTDERLNALIDVVQQGRNGNS
jgi:anti-sigma factor ChrR (cupin superfamily)